jgi:RNA polymerase sigma factor (sigma-70 family)
MADGQLGTVLRHIRQLAVAQSTRELSDGPLLERFTVSKDQAAFAALVQRYGRLVWSVCRHVLGHDQDAEDSFQATFLVLAQRAGSIRRSEAVASWLHGVAYRVAMKAKRDAARRRARERAAQPLSQGQPFSDTGLRELQAVLDDEVRRLPEKFRAPFVLCCLEGKSAPEAARLLRWKVGTVSGRLSLAREELQRRLTRRGLALSAPLCALAISRTVEASSVPAGLTSATVRGALAHCGGHAAA